MGHTHRLNDPCNSLATVLIPRIRRYYKLESLSIMSPSPWKHRTMLKGTACLANVSAFRHSGMRPTHTRMRHTSIATPAILAKTLMKMVKIRRLFS